MTNVFLYAGEQRTMYIKVMVDTDATFYITNASYKLLKKGEVISEGPLLVNDHEMSTSLNPLEEGTYTLIADFWVAGEHLIRSHDIFVRN